MIPIIGLVFAVLSISPIATGTESSQVTGKYAIDRNACAISDFSGLSRVVIEYRKVTVDRDRFPALIVTAYNLKNSTSDTLIIGKLEDTATGAGGKEISTGSFDDRGFHAVKHFIRYGNRTWPDLEMKTSMHLLKSPLGLTIEKTSEILTGRPTTKTTSCKLLSLLNDPREIKFRPLFGELQNAQLNDLKAAKMNQGMDLDQATVDISAIHISEKNPSLSQLKEVVALQVLGTYSGLNEMKIQLVKGQQRPEAIASTALGPALRFADEDQPDEYQSLFDLRDLIAQTIRHATSSIKVYSLQWSDSNNEGAGVLFLDTTNQEALYLGASYHE